jgi:hypothetical protein
MATAPLYRPPTKITTIEIPWIAVVSRADPDWARFKHREIEYEFSRRNFYGDPYHRGAYSGVFDNPLNF